MKYSYLSVKIYANIEVLLLLFIIKSIHVKILYDV